LGEFNNWDKETGFSLKKGKDGTMEATVALEAGRSYQYRYLLDGGRWENDHRADGYLQVEGHDVYNCVVHVPVPELAAAKSIKKAAATKPKNAGKKIELPTVEAAEKATAKVKTLAKETSVEKKAKPAVKANGAVKQKSETKPATGQKTASKSDPVQKAASKTAAKTAAPASPKKTSTKGK
jgi:hypothetical protein